MSITYVGDQDDMDFDAKAIYGGANTLRKLLPEQKKQQPNQFAIAVANLETPRKTPSQSQRNGYERYEKDKLSVLPSHMIPPESTYTDFGKRP